MSSIEIHKIASVYFIGAGGIGMSALVRYFLSKGKKVAGYDRTPTELTRKLEEEGASLHYEENTGLIPGWCRDKATTLVVYTPAIPSTHLELNYFIQAGFVVMKRSQVLGLITRASKGLCIAGTHGKTTTSTITAHLFYQSHLGCTAFLGGISQNYHTNLLLDKESDFTVIEADEFDRSFHWLNPWMSVITSTDPDHLDIYGTEEHYLESFDRYAQLTAPGGALVIHRDASVRTAGLNQVRIYSYSREEGDFHARNVRIGAGEIRFDLITPDGPIRDILLGVPLSINIENSIAAMALGWLNGLTVEEIRSGIATFRGVERRFDFKIKEPRLVYLNDYAHHPSEIRQCLSSVRELYPGKKITAVFQPHLYSRTHDFYKEFAAALSLADEVILIPIYPARELPIAGVSSELIYTHIKEGVRKELATKEALPELLEKRKPEIEVLITLGAGDIEEYVAPIEKILRER